MIAVVWFSLLFSRVARAEEIQKGKFFIHLSGGVGFIDVKDINDCVRYQKNALEPSAEYVNWDEVKTSQDFNLELIWNLSESLGIGIGSGYVFFNNAGDYGNKDKTFFRYEKWRLKAFPLFANLHYSVPLNGRMMLRITGGAAYYFGSLKGNKGYQADHSYGYGETARKEYDVDASSNSLGAQPGLGVDIKLMRNMSLTVEGSYRFLKFKDLKGTKTEDNSPLPACYLWHAEYEDASQVKHHDSAFQPEPSNNPPWFWRRAEYNLSGLALKVGIKYEFGSLLK